MAISKMKKLSVLTPESKTDGLMKELQRLRATKIEQLPDTDLSLTEMLQKDSDLSEVTLPDFILPEVIGSAWELDRKNISDVLDSVNKKITALEDAISFLDVFHTGKNPLFKKPEYIDIREYEKNFVSYAEADTSEAIRIKNTLSEANRQIDLLSAEAESIIPFAELKIDLPKYSTETTQTICGTLPASVNLSVIGEALSEHGCVFEVLIETKASKSASLTALNDEFDSCLSVLTSNGFVPTSAVVSRSDGYAKGKLKTIKDKLKDCYNVADTERANAEKLANEKLDSLKKYLDFLESEKSRIEEEAKIRTTEGYNVIGAYVPEKSVENVTKVLEAFGVAYEFSSPEPTKENVPVKLENNWLATQFEPIVGMYALPVYGGFDPTPAMCIFYILIFGMMFADVGYGLLLSLGCFLGLRLIRPRGNMKKLLTMFGICGISSIVNGVIFGGYFGDLPTRIMTDFLGMTETPSLAVGFDMVADPMSFIIVALVLGAVHLLFGMALKFYILCKAGHPFCAIFDVGSWFILFGGIGMFLVFKTVGLCMIIAGVLMLVLSQGREAKNPVMRIAKGLLSLYDIISYGSDLLSYARIVALGLASAVIASVVNIFGTMGGAGIGGVFSLILAFLIGHTLNFAINILGTYVHTSRLQYIEFFGKFYESGGREFVPMAPTEKSVRFSESD